MITLSATTDSFIVTSSSTAPLDYSTTFVDVNTTAQTFVPGTSKGKIVTAVDTTIVASPGGTDIRQAKVITITNIDPAVTNVISVSKLSSVGPTKYKMTPDITLLAGESFVYMHGVGWVYYAVNGSIKAQQSAAGSSTWIQYNSSGLLAGSSAFTFDPATNDLSLLGADSNFIMKGITNEPSAPSSGNLTLYNSKVAGKQVLKYLGTTGSAMYFQNAVWNIHTTKWVAGVAAGTSEGTTFTNAGTNALVVPTNTNWYTSMVKSTFANIITTTNQQVGIRSAVQFFRGNATGLGGFFFNCRFGFSSYKTGSRLFVGMCVVGANIVTADASSLTNIAGFGFDLADSAITFMHNDGAGTATKDTIAGQPALANNQGYDAYIWCAPNDTTIYYRLVDGLTGAVIIESSANSDLPVNTTGLGACCLASNGTANVAAGDVSLGINHLIVETER